MSKYPISKEFFPFSLFSPPISEKFLKIAVPNMKVPKFIYKDKEIETVRYEVKSFDNETVEFFSFLRERLKRTHHALSIFTEADLYCLQQAITTKMQ